MRLPVGLLAPALLVVPVITAAVTLLEPVGIDAAAGTPTATLAQGELGTATLGSSATSADVTASSLPALVADDFLVLQGGPTGWSMHVELLSESGWSGSLDEVTVTISDGTTTRTQVRVTVLGVLQDAGTPLSLATGTDVEVRAVGKGTGFLEMDLVLDLGAGAELRYRATLTVG